MGIYFWDLGFSARMTLVDFGEMGITGFGDVGEGGFGTGWELSSV